MGLTVTNFFEQKEINKNAIAVDRFLECTNLKYDDNCFIAIGEVEIKMLHKKKERNVTKRTRNENNKTS